MANGRTVLLFTRAPEAEARAKQLPIVEGARVFAGFLQGWEQRAEDAGASLLVVAPESSQSALKRLLPGACIATQSGASFAARIESAFAFAFESGTNAVLMVGGDCPPLEASEIHDAFAHLESHGRALVLAPSDDGGVNAIGFNALADRPLAGINWQSSQVYRELTREAVRCGLAILLTSAGHDLDCAGNVAALYRLSRGESIWSVFRWLLRSLLLVSRSNALVVTRSVSCLAVDSHTTRGPPLLSIT
jgi:glycosyltransferase A (GT-A) superfamily protein (DUF2064 family)